MMTRGKGRKLRSGFTTGTAAAAATKGALKLLLGGRFPEQVRIRLLTGDWIRIPVHSAAKTGPLTARCTVIKDAGDDPDVTHKAEIGAEVRFDKGDDLQAATILGGKGVGRVTKPGLSIPVGDPAITEGPREMITEAVRDVLEEFGAQGSVTTEIFVPEGENLAKKTLNARLGILGGISILGTTGVVRPISHDAYLATIDASLSVARAAGLDTVVLTTGRRGERFSQKQWKHLPEEAFIQMGDFFKRTMEKVAGMGFKKAIITVFIGKAVKMAQGIPHTHASKATQTLGKLAGWAMEVTHDPELSARIAEANTARHALEYILPAHPEVVRRVGEEMKASAQTFAGPGLQIQGVIYGFEGEMIFNSETAP